MECPLGSLGVGGGLAWPWCFHGGGFDGDSLGVTMGGSLLGCVSVMTGWFSRFFAVVMVACALSLVSCIEGDEEVFLYADGSGRVVAEYRVPGVLISAEDGVSLQESIRAAVAASEDLELVSSEVVMEEGFRVISMEISSSDVRGLGALGGGEDNDGGLGEEGDKSGDLLAAIIGEMKLGQRGLVLNLQRDVDLSAVLGRYFGEGALSQMGDSMFRYRLHLPSAARSSNAHAVSNGGKTLQWEYRLADSREVPMSMAVQMAMALPWWVYAIGGLVVVVLVVVLAGGVVAWRKGRSAGRES